MKKKKELLLEKNNFVLQLVSQQSLIFYLEVASKEFNLHSGIHAEKRFVKSTL